MSDLSRCKWNNGHASGKEYLEEQQDKETNKILEMLKTEKQQKEIDSLKQQLKERDDKIKRLEKDNKELSWNGALNRLKEEEENKKLLEFISNYF